MLYQLSTGRTIEISLEQYLSMSDDELNGLVQYGGACEGVEDPFFRSAMFSAQDDIEEEIIEELPDIVETPTEEKFDFLGLEPED